MLHLAAVGCGVFAALAHPCWRQRRSWPGLSACVLMLVAMIHAGYVSRGSTVFWSALLILVALGISAAQARGRNAVGSDRLDGACVIAHDSLGLITTAALLPLMHSGSIVAAGTGSPGHSGHSLGGGLLITVVLAIAASYIVASGVAWVQSAGRAGRLQYPAMGGMAALMAASALA